MKFADKLFLAITALLTVIFTAFGTWFLVLGFSKLRNSEIQRSKGDSLVFQCLFEMGYQASAEYGNDYAVQYTMERIRSSVEKNDSHCFVLDENGNCIFGMQYLEGDLLWEEIDRICQSLVGQNTLGYMISQNNENHYLLMLIKTDGEPSNYLGILKNLDEIYRFREGLFQQYMIALTVLLMLGAAGIYILSRLITRPIRQLGRVADRIADGDYAVRSRIVSSDELGELAQNFNRMADKLVEQLESKVIEAKQKEDFTAAFAHELKTPLTSIIGYADMMNTMQLSENEKAEALYYIYSQGKRLESLSHKLLELVSMDKNPLDMKKIQTKKLEENIRAAFRPVFEARSIKGKIELEKGSIMGDEELLLSLFYNLLDNAVKAMDKGDYGFILMRGSVIRDRGYEVKVVDNGRGIPEEEIDRITEAFYMVDKSRSRREGGAGIGMALCRKIIQLHQATLQIDSKLGQGTVMKVIFPAMLEAEKGKSSS